MELLAGVIAQTNAVLAVVCIGLASSTIYTTNVLANEPPYGPHRRTAPVNAQGAAAAACLIAAVACTLTACKMAKWETTTTWASPCVFLLVHLALVPHTTFFHSLLAFLVGAFTIEASALAPAARALATQAPVALLFWSTGTLVSAAPVIAISFMAVLRIVIPLALDRGGKDDADAPPLYVLDAALAGAGAAVRCAY